jgi:hypothetical protein
MLHGTSFQATLNVVQRKAAAQVAWSVPHFSLGTNYLHHSPTLFCYITLVSPLLQDVQLRSEPYFNMSNLFTNIYNMLYYTTNLYLQQVFEMMSIHFYALIDTFHHVPRKFS